MDYWKNGPPPDDDAILAQICRMSNDAWSNASSTIRAFFKHSNGHLVHSRIDREMGKAKEKKEAFVAKAKEAAKVRWEKHASSTAQALLESCPSPSPSPSSLPSTSESPSESQDSKSTTKSKPLQPATQSAPKKKVLSEEDSALQEICRQTWGAYSEAYQDRYGIAPVRNTKISAQVKQFCKRVPAAEAPHIAAFYVRHNQAFYVGKGHAFGQLLADAEKVRTEWATNSTVTQSQARQADATQGRVNVWSEVINEIKERDRYEAINQPE